MKIIKKTEKINEKKMKYKIGDFVKKRLKKDSAFSKGYETNE